MVLEAEDGGQIQKCEIGSSRLSLRKVNRKRLSSKKEQLIHDFIFLDFSSLFDESVSSMLLEIFGINKTFVF